MGEGDERGGVRRAEVSVAKSLRRAKDGWYETHFEVFPINRGEI